MHLQTAFFLVVSVSLAFGASPRKSSILGDTLIGQPCTTPEQCVVPEKSECPEDADPRVCKCQDAYFPWDNNSDCLIKRPELEFSCTVNEQCEVPDSECGGGEEGANKICQCKASHIQPPTDRTTCNLRATLIGGPCNEADNQCASVTDSVCEGTGGARTCGCNAATHVEKEDKSKCLPIREFEQSCEESTQCAKIQDADCLPEGEGDGSKCLCKDGFIMSSDRSGCLKKVEDLHAECTSDSQCQVGNSECARVGEGDDAKAQCECRDSFLESAAAPGTCISIVHEVDKPCTEPIQCTVGLGDQAECVGEDDAKECKCKTGAVTFERHCYKAAGAVGEDCQVSAQCQLNLGYGTCQADGKCGCESGATETGGKCTRPKIGEPCTATEQCPGGNSGSTWCNSDSKECECIEGHVAKGDNSGCLVLALELDLPCEEQQQCKVDESTCEGPDGNKVCGCGETHVPSIAKDRCLQKLPLEGNCEEPQQCSEQVEHSECLGEEEATKKCKCSADFIAPPQSTTACNAKALIGGSCAVHDSQCAIPGASCQAGEGGARICQCNAGFTAEGNTKCNENKKDDGKKDDSGADYIAQVSTFTIVFTCIVSIFMR